MFLLNGKWINLRSGVVESYLSKSDNPWLPQGLPQTALVPSHEFGCTFGMATNGEPDAIILCQGIEQLILRSCVKNQMHYARMYMYVFVFMPPPPPDTPDLSSPYLNACTYNL